MTTVNDPLAFARLIPGFDFMRQFAQAATSQGAPANFADWIAPTVNIEELDKRIADLKAVQFWLEQNAQAVRATTQALEVQKMTLSALQGMNFNLPDLAKAFAVPDSPAPAPAPEAARPGAPFGSERDSAPALVQTGASPAKAPAQPARAHAEKRAETPASGLPDPVQWWEALTQQFQTIAANALDEAARAAPFTGRTARAGAGRKSVAQPAAKRTAKSATPSAAKSAARGVVRRTAQKKKSPRRGSAA